MNEDITIFHEPAEIIEVFLDEVKHPFAFKRAVESLMLSGVDDDYARRVISTTPFVLEVAYSKDRGLFAVESEALGSLGNEMFDPYTGENVQVDGYDDTTELPA